jgi:hypothetical protein
MMAGRRGRGKPGLRPGPRAGAGSPRHPQVPPPRPSTGQSDGRGGGRRNGGTRGCRSCWRTLAGLPWVSGRSKRQWACRLDGLYDRPKFRHNARVRMGGLAADAIG